MTQCIYERIGDGEKKPHKYRCGYCGHERESNYSAGRLHRDCGIRPKVEREMQPGNVLHRLLRERIGVDTTKKCDCDSKRILMNMWGPEGCRKNLEWIVGELLSEATKRSWQIEGRVMLSLAAKIGTKTAWGMAYARSWARALVLEAIETCEA